MKKNFRNILYFTRTMELGGTENVILQLCEIMKPESSKIVVCSCGGVNVKKLKKMGIRHYTIPDIEKKDLKTIITVLKTVKMIIKKEDINIVHTHHRMAAFYTRIISLNKKFVFIHEAHNTFNNKKRLTKFALNKANIIAVGEKVKENLCDFYKIPELHVEVIHNAVKTFKDPIIPLEVLKNYKDKGYFLIGNVGRLSDQKGMVYFIKAAHLVLKKVSKIKFFIIGDGENKKSLINLISNLKLEKDVILLGYRNDVQNIMSQLDLIVLSSLWEGLPLTPIEAFSVKKTIVATKVDGTTEIVNDGINGALVEPKNSEAIADKILELYNSPNIIKTYEENAYKKYNEEFSYENLKEKYKRYYNKIINRG